ncbi:MAG TPA: isocitrate lyase/phosphoenolpyruvate mutase family protein [Frankiaceae bacterium]|nr:isocitrate lyase/phosphoenolpyruvate mutase family protein [Frankiaceae bacterium]
MGPDRSSPLLALHHADTPLVVPNPWNAGSALLLQWLGFGALATTSSGFASSLGRLDGAVSREETLAECGRIVDAVSIPVTADLVNGFADDPAGVAGTVTDAIGVGLAGCSVEDFTGSEHAAIYDLGLAVERVAAAAEAAHSGERKLVLTARAENYLHGAPDLKDTIARLQAFQEAGADVLYAPGLTAVADIEALVSSVDAPVNVLLLAAGPSVAHLADLGVSRISVGGSLAYAAFGALVDAARDLRNGSPDFWDLAKRGRDGARASFQP